MFIPELGESLLGRVIDTHHNPLKFSKDLWRARLPWKGDRWILTAYVMPDVPPATLEGLGFPVAPSPSSVTLQDIPSQNAGSEASSAAVLLPTVQPGEVKPSLPLGAKNWGRRSTIGSANFAHHQLVLQPSRPPSSSSSSALQQELASAWRGARIFLDICAGSERPLSAAILARGGSVLSVDLLLHESMDLLCNSFYEQLLHVCGSGIVGYAAASPSCSEYSLLKLRGDPPFATRTPESLDGLPGQTISDYQRVQESHELLARCCMCLSVVHASGGHGHLEQPSNAMSWREVCTQSWLQQSSAVLVLLPACMFNEDWAKTWLMASSFQPLGSLGAICPHGNHAHPAQYCRCVGGFSSRKTAKYPPDLATAFAHNIFPLLSASGQDLTLASAQALIPVKSVSAYPWCKHDGAGKNSQGDWSIPNASDVFQPLRKCLLDLCIKWQGPSRILARAVHPSKEPLYTPREVAEARSKFFPALSIANPADAWLPRVHQPLCLNALEALSLHVGDADIHLLPALKSGVPTGYHSDIPPSFSFWPNMQAGPEEVPLSIHMQNWRSATVDASVTQRLLDEEISQGFCFKYSGSLEDAKRTWPDGLAIGKLGVVRAPGRSERLVLDNTICGTNANCCIPERQCMPTVRDVKASYPLRGSSSMQAALSLDIKSAHKRVVIKPSEVGLLGFTFDNALYFYRVAPFGAVFAQHWWGRLGSLILRLLHLLLWIPHSGHLFVDDYLFTMVAELMPLMGSMVCLFMQVLGIPLSWHKLQLGCRVQWLGWAFDFAAGTVSLSTQKRHKLLAMVQSLQKNPRITKKDFERFVGLALWACNVFPVMKALLRTFYHDMHTPYITHYSIPPEEWRFMPSHLNDDLVFTSAPRGTFIPVGSRLLAVRHQNVQRKQDLQHVRISDRRVWLRISNLGSTRRRLSGESCRILHIFEHWLLHLNPMVTMRPPVTIPFEAFADARASGNTCTIGGYVSHPALGQVWFSESFKYSDFARMGIPVKHDMQRDIACYEALAQAGLILAVTHLCPCSRVPIRLCSGSDNVGAEASINNTFTTARPLAFFLERIALLSAMFHVLLDVSHIPGAMNVKSDALSRPAEKAHPLDCTSDTRLKLQLADLWQPSPRVSVSPAEANLSWHLLSNGRP